MPCSTCTTGSPTRSSARSRIIASTFEARSRCLPRSRRGLAANSSVSVMDRESRGSRSAKPSCSGATPSAIRAGPARELGEVPRCRQTGCRIRRASGRSSRAGPPSRRRSGCGRRSPRRTGAGARAGLRRAARPRVGGSGAYGVPSSVGSALAQHQRRMSLRQREELLGIAGTARPAAGSGAPGRARGSGGARWSRSRSAASRASIGPCSASRASRGR